MLEVMKNKHAVALGRLGGLAGGPARAKALSIERRSEIARLARAARTRRERVRQAAEISARTGADAGVVEHVFRLMEKTPFERLAAGLRMGRSFFRLRGGLA